MGANLGVWGPAAGCWGSGDKQSLQLLEARGFRGVFFSARRFLQFFNKNNAFLGIFRPKFLLSNRL